MKIGSQVIVVIVSLRERLCCELSPYEALKNINVNLS